MNNKINDKLNNFNVIYLNKKRFSSQTREKKN